MIHSADSGQEEAGCNRLQQCLPLPLFIKINVEKNNKNKVKTLQLHLTAATSCIHTLNIQIRAVHCGSFSVSLSFTNM